MPEVWLYHQRTHRTGLLVDFASWPPPGHDKQPNAMSPAEWEAQFYVRVAYSADRYADGRPREGGIKWVRTDRVRLANLDEIRAATAAFREGSDGLPLRQTAGR